MVLSALFFIILSLLFSMFLLISLVALVYTVTVKMACILFAIWGCFSYSCLSCAVTEDKHLCTLL